MTRPTAFRTTVLVVAAIATTTSQARAQVLSGAPLPVLSVPPPAELQRVYDSAELDRILSPIALYPDPLLAQVLTAATFASDIPAAMRWLDARRGRDARYLAEALSAERVAWDPSVQSLIAFPTVLQMMATSMPWTAEIGDAFSSQRADVMDAVQRLREQAHRYGYLQSTGQIRVVRSPAIEILPVHPEYVVVPYYNPVVVFAPPRPRFLLSSAIHLGFGVRLGLWYEPWGWQRSGFHWPTRHVIGGYPGWNRGRVHSDVVIRNRYDVPRYSSPSVHVTRRDHDRRDVATQQRPEYRQRSDWGSNGRDGRDARSGRDDRGVSQEGRVARPRASQPTPEREVRRAEAQPQDRGGSQRGGRESQQGGGTYRKRN